MQHSSTFLSATRRSWVLALPALALFSLHAETAQACGGLFCSATSPVNQAAERIIFAQDADQNVTQIVEILYEGPSQSFAWVLPVPGTPEVGVSSTVALDRLQQATNPQYQFNNINPGTCGDRFFGAPTASADSGSLGAEDGGGLVTVVDSGSVGPYDYETISLNPALTDPAQVAVDWLTINGYDIGELGAEVLRPYLANGLNLIAVRLQKDKSAGAIRPLTLKYKSRALAIPIRPTAVAANEDMGVLVWILGERRAVPINYNGLELNDLLIDWFNPGNTYNLVVSAAANEAGGQGFVTEFAGKATDYKARLYFGESVEGYSNSTDVAVAIQELTQQLAGYDGFLEVAAQELTLREGFTLETFVGSPYCYFHTEDCYGVADPSVTAFTSDDPILDTDLEQFKAELNRLVIDPLKDTAELFDQFDYVTRLYTTMSPDEMTKDPTFDFNPDLPDESNLHTADRYLTCDGAGGDWKVVLPSGRTVYGSGFSWPYSLEDDFPATARITTFGTSGGAVVVADNTSAIKDLYSSSQPAQVTHAFKEDGGCAVSGTPRPRGPWSAFAFLGGGFLMTSWLRRRTSRRA